MRIKDKERQIESAAFDHRQKVISDLEMLRMKEQEMKKTMEMELMCIRTERDQCAVRQREAELKLKALCVVYMKDGVAQYKYPDGNWRKNF